MWRRNVLRVRNCSSPVPVPIHVLRIGRRCYTVEGREGTEKTLPISDEEFVAAFEDIAKPRWRERRQKIGLAVSGGVDSMALATLYSRNKANWSEDDIPLECHGFIIDHKMRPESTEEAEWVAQQLRLKFDMEATVIPLVWPSDADPSRFESEARALRYQALGRACRDNMIKWLMVAHHADDQAETIMMRIMNMRVRSGLQCMHKVMHIPECYGMHGIYQSGEIDAPLLIDTESKHKTPTLPHPGATWNGMPFETEKGGIQLLRPLLEFQKSRLVATCEEYSTPWAEDKTNKDTTLTTRNAIRHILHNHKLPAALSVPSLIRVGERTQARMKALDDVVETLLSKTKLKLDIQTGSLIMRPPPISALLDGPILAQTDKAKAMARDHAYRLLTTVIELVSPLEKINLATMSSAVPRIFPELLTDHDKPMLAGSKKNNFCANGVWWRPWKGPAVFGGEEGGEWLVSRQPLMVNQEKLEKMRIVFPPALSSSSAGSPRSGKAKNKKPPPKENVKEAPWHYFDGRFWFRLTNHTTQEIVLRALTKSEQESPTLGSPEVSQHQGQIKAALAMIYPPDLRRNIPALFIRSPSPSANGEYKETLIALPTLDVIVSKLKLNASGSRPCDWEVRYKNINSSGSEHLQDIVIPGIRHHHIKREEERQASKDEAEREKREAEAAKVQVLESESTTTQIQESKERPAALPDLQNGKEDFPATGLSESASNDAAESEEVPDFKDSEVQDVELGKEDFPSKASKGDSFPDVEDSDIHDPKTRKADVPYNASKGDPFPYAEDSDIHDIHDPTTRKADVPYNASKGDPFPDVEDSDIHDPKTRKADHSYDASESDPFPNVEDSDIQEPKPHKVIFPPTSATSLPPNNDRENVEFTGFTNSEVRRMIERVKRNPSINYDIFYRAITATSREKQAADKVRAAASRERTAATSMKRFRKIRQSIVRKIDFTLPEHEEQLADIQRAQVKVQVNWKTFRRLELSGLDTEASGSKPAEADGTSQTKPRAMTKADLEGLGFLEDDVSTVQYSNHPTTTHHEDDGTASVPPDEEASLAQLYTMVTATERRARVKAFRKFLNKNYYWGKLSAKE